MYFVGAGESKAVAGIEALRAHLAKASERATTVYRDDLYVTVGGVVTRNSTKISLSSAIEPHSYVPHSYVYIGTTIFPTICDVVREFHYCWDGVARVLLLSALGKLCLEKKAHVLRVDPTGVHDWFSTAPVVGFDLIVPNLKPAKMSEKGMFTAKDAAVVLRRCCGGRWHGVPQVTDEWYSCELTGESAAAWLLSNVEPKYRGLIEQPGCVVIAPGQGVDVIIPYGDVEEEAKIRARLFLRSDSITENIELYGSEWLAMMLKERFGDQAEEQRDAQIAQIIGHAITSVTTPREKGVLPLTFTRGATKLDASRAETLRRDWYGAYYRDI